MQNFVVWFEIPVKNISRAIGFYSKVMDVELQPTEMGPNKLAMFPFEPGVASGALVESSENKPSSTGTMIYLNGGDDLSAPLSRVLSAGGKIIEQKTSIGEHGFMAMFEDTEGNHVALHSMK